ncbi:MAG: epoxyqueuosine reductase [Armatimonadota bacterium]|nr:epoxyqueuosine reductase [bacterium]
MSISSTDIKKMAAEMGADLCGIAPVDRFSEAPKGYHPCDALPECKSVIVLAMRFSEETISDLDVYLRERNRVCNLVDEVARGLSEQLNKTGFDSIPIYSLRPCSTGGDGRIHGLLSLKHAGLLAGMGTIGKNSLLINDKFGNMIWLSAVLTTAELNADALATYEGCIPECRLCIDKCSVEAMHQEPMNQFKCYSHAFGKENGTESINCIACRVVCPHCFGIR